MADAATDSVENSVELRTLRECSHVIYQSDINPILLAESLVEKFLITEEAKRGIIECECKEDQFRLLLDAVSSTIQESDMIFKRFITLIAVQNRDVARTIMEEYKQIRTEHDEIEQQIEIEKESEEKSVERRIMEMRRMLEPYHGQCQLGRHRAQNRPQ